MAGLKAASPAPDRRRFATYLAVGVLNTAVGYSTFALLVFFGLHYSIAALVSTICGVLFNFQAIGRLVFRNHDASRIFRFAAVYAITYALNLAGLRALQATGLDLYAAGALLLALMAVLSFLLHRSFVFRSEAIPS